MPRAAVSVSTADHTIAAGWRQAFNRHVALRWGLTGTELPQELNDLAARLQPAGAGRWTMNASGLTQYVGVALAGALPLLALTMRRFRALDARETWGLAAIVAVLVLEPLTGR